MALLPQENEPRKPNWGQRLKVTGIATTPFFVGFGIEKLAGGTLEQAFRSGLLLEAEIFALAALIFMGVLITGGFNRK